MWLWKEGNEKKRAVMKVIEDSKIREERLAIMFMTGTLL